MIGSDYQQFAATLKKVIALQSDLDEIPLEDLLQSIPNLEALDAVPSGETVLVRADLDMPISSSKIADLSRVKANFPTIKRCQERGFKVVIFGHLGRKPNVSVRPVATLTLRN